MVIAFHKKNGEANGSACYLDIDSTLIFQDNL